MLVGIKAQGQLVIQSDDEQRLDAYVVGVWGRSAEGTTERAG